MIEGLYSPSTKLLERKIGMKTKVLMSENGAVQLPASLLKFVGFKPGDSITVETSESGHIELFSSASHAHRNANDEQQRALREWIFNDESDE